MNKTNVAQQPKTASFLPPVQRMLQRKCACGNHSIAGGECSECAKKTVLQRKLTIGASNDPLEFEADRIAEQVMAASAHSTTSRAPVRIQRYAGQATEDLEAAPASVDHVLTGSGRPLEPGLRQDMEHRFGHNFSQVRLHTGSAAEQSARDVNAHAYTVGNNVVFGSGQFAPGVHEGRRLIAHELTHVVQQGNGISAKMIQRSWDWGRAGAGALIGGVGGAVVGGLIGGPVGAAVGAGVGGIAGGLIGGLTGKSKASSPKTVNIDAVKLRGAKRDPAADVAFANTVFKPASVQFNLVKNETATAADSDTWIGGDTTISTGTCGTATKEELDTWGGAANKFKLSSRLRAFYVDSISSGSRADSYPPYCATGTAAPLSGMATVSNTGASRSLAHELGHILINSGDHPADTNNLMNPTNTATGNDLTAAQQSSIYSNA